jgi:hypothetical protein
MIAALTEKYAGKKVLIGRDKNDVEYFISTFSKSYALKKG